MKALSGIVDPSLSERDAVTDDSLRTRKKAQQRQLLIDVAMKLFAESGYDQVRMDEIATVAQVSTKTVYNYFGSKRDILAEFMFADRNDDTLAIFQSVLDSRSNDLVKDLMRLFRADVGYVPTDGSKQLWLEIVAATIKDGSDERFQRVRLIFTQYIERLIALYQGDGAVRPGLNCGIAAKIVHLIFTDGFVRICSSSESEFADAMTSVNDALLQLVEPWVSG